MLSKPIEEQPERLTSSKKAVATPLASLEVPPRTPKMCSKAALALSARTGGRCCALAPAFRWHRPMRGGRTHSGHHRRQEYSQELQGKVDELGRRGGFVQGQDLVVISSIDGVIGDVPPWLALELAPTGNPPELEATMTPAARAMSERARVKMLSFVH